MESDRFHRRNLKYNFTVGLFDGGFFGFALGFGSFVTILPLFVSQLTDSALLIGLIPAIHNVGWQLPQLFTASWVSRMSRYKPAVLWLTILERAPFLGLATVAWFLPGLDKELALAITFGILIWQGLGGGLTANPWTSMISKIIPSDVRGTFFGFQSAAANALASLSAVLAGFILGRFDSPLDFALCFLMTGAAMAVGWIFLALTREAPTPASTVPRTAAESRTRAWKIFRRDRLFRRFLLVRVLGQFATMGFSFYIVYAVREFNLDEWNAGVMTGIYMFSQILANPLMGWMGDRWSHRRVMVFGAAAAIASSLLAWQAESLAWFYPVFILAAIAVVSIWTIGTAMTTEFGTAAERPLYIGMANTLIAPATILAPIFGGLLADFIGYDATFLATAAGGMTATLVMLSIDEKRPRLGDSLQF